MSQVEAQLLIRLLAEAAPEYRIVQLIGRGGMGSVFLAEDQRLGRHVALKVLHASSVSSSLIETRVSNEARALAAINHPNIVTIYAFHELGGLHMIEMEYVPGGSLQELLRNGTIAPTESLRLTAQMLCGLHACHKADIAHCDLKPSNVLIDAFGNVKLTDFGLASVVRDDATEGGRTTSTFVGTPKYAPPEAWNGEPRSPKWDIYSVGMILLELLSGRTPYDSATPFEVMRRMVSEPSPHIASFVPEASEPLKAAVGAMLHRDPKKRPASAVDSLAVLQACPEYLPPSDSAQETLRIPRVRKPSASRSVMLRRTAYLAGVLACVGLSALTFSGASGSLESQGTRLAMQSPRVVLAGGGTIYENFDPDHLAAIGDYIVFTAATEDAADSLWSYSSVDGRCEMLVDVRGIPIRYWELHDGMDASGRLVFGLSYEDGSTYLYGTDGTPAGTELLLEGNTLSGDCRLLTSDGIHVYVNFMCEHVPKGLWETDGTPDGTRFVFGDPIDGMDITGARVDATGDVYFVSGDAMTLLRYARSVDAVQVVHRGETVFATGDLVPLHDGVIMQSFRETVGIEPVLYSANRPPELLADINPGVSHGLHHPNFQAFGDRVIFAGVSEADGREPWISDGTRDGTHILLDINGGSANSTPFRFTQVGDRCFFRAKDRINGAELWVTDGTSDGTKLVMDIALGNNDGEPYAFCAYNDGLLFSANDGKLGEELWFSDGTTAETWPVADIWPGQNPVSSAPWSSEPHGTLVVNDWAYFGATTQKHGRVLWRSDGTPQGTQAVLPYLVAP